jgi:hypothetical protein
MVLDSGHPTGSPIDLNFLDLGVLENAANLGEFEVAKEPRTEQMAKHTKEQVNDHQINKEAEEEVTELHRANSKRTNAPDIPNKTRQSSRVQDADAYIQEGHCQES